ncbi:MAG: hypothetical protein ACI87F_000794, partial [Candidatus Azotimanducaceae bacterium]
GFGVMSIYESLKSFAPKKVVALSVTVLSLIAVPVLMASQNWNNHDRSNRYTSHLNAKAYLDSTQENAIMFTIGDNDTFPLWYMQEVEGYRTDLKLVNTSLFATDWYIDQMKRKSYKAAPIPSQLTHEEYRWGTLDDAYLVEVPQFKDSVITIDYLMRWFQSDNEITYVESINDKSIKTYPTNRIRIPVDKESVLRNNIVKEKDADLIVPYIDIEIDPVRLTKNQILMLDIIANNNWERPIYFTGGASADAEYIWMKDYLQADGITFKLVPIKTAIEGRSLFDMGRLDTDINYAFIKNIDWKTITDDGIYLDTETRKNAVTFRNNMIRLTEALINEGKLEKAEEIIDLSLEKMPINKFMHYGMLLGYPEAYYELRNTEKARKTTEELAEVFKQKLNYYSQFDTNYLESIFDEIENNILMYDQLVTTAIQYDDTEYSNELLRNFLEKISLYNFSPDQFLLGYIDSYYRNKNPEKARDITQELITKFEENLGRYSKLQGNDLKVAFDEIENNLLMYDRLVKTTMRFDSEEASTEIKIKYINQLKLFSHLLED